MRFLIIDGYARENREQLRAAGMRLASELHVRMLQHAEPSADYNIIYPSDVGVVAPSTDELRAYSGIIWTGCDKSLADADNPDVETQLDLARRILEAERACWGTCWGIQIMAAAAGGEVQRNPKGREMGFARKIVLTPEGKTHPMYAGKKEVFDALASHCDIVTKVPSGAVILAANDYSPVQAMAFSYGKGTFWGVQYHPDYDTHELARLMAIRKNVLISEGFFNDSRDFDTYIAGMEALAENPGDSRLRRQMGADEDVLSPDMRQLEFANWIKGVRAGSL